MPFPALGRTAGALISSGTQPADEVRRVDIEDRVFRLDIVGPAFSVSIDLFQVVAGTSGEGAQISFRPVSWLGLDNVAVLRNLSRDQGSASLLESFPASALKPRCLTTFSDQDSRLTTSAFFYWLKAIPQNKTLAAVYTGPVSIGPTPAGPAGTVTSVGLSMPVEFAVSGSPVTGAGTLAVTKASESANQVWAGPASGSPAAPAFRALVPADLQAALASGFYRLIRVFMITASGTYNPTSGARALYVECVGGGGAGGGAQAVSASSAPAMGGGGGAYSAVFLTALKSSYSVVVGAGGVGAAAAAGGNGFDTGFDSPSVCTAKGGGGGNFGSSGTIVGLTGAASNGGSAAGGIGDLRCDGSDGMFGVRLAAASGWGGSGGASPLGAGSVNMLYSNNANGQAGKNYGGGGSGAINNGTNASTFAGGNGAGGLIRLWEFG